MRLRTSLAVNRTAELWRGFMPRRHEVPASSADLISLQMYPPGYFDHFNPNLEFEKWACMEADAIRSVPEGMETFILTGGLYAVFRYKGLNTDTVVFEYIFNTWLPQSVYQLEHRPHFEVMGSLYKNNDPDSEEDIYIPVGLK